ncbi:NAC domain-containing protein 71-like [Punica granatum]|uniref:NAC domain-containing protein n=2 Tax=Punica granatum TaxID=22663 RepID=A0A218WF69_PUNGR|nr:NAC domain-containing protein 71-like [Punica granatum]OWM70861.1 hypothetical protein CDL15_Pgr014534 [Punica granatum]PKI69715.1 hypothetical protein CRG98_009871 [Punica granatum]
MGDPKAGDRPVFPLPPGSRFYPSEDQLFDVYLVNKNTNPSGEDPCNVIRELDLYRHFPPELPDSVCFPYGCGGRKRHWYCYTVRAASRDRRSRRVKGGFWRKRGRVRDVTGGRGRKVLLGTRTCFVFYSGNSAKTAIRTDWIMYEYALVDHFKASFVLCRVFVKAKRGNVSAKLMRSCADESGSQVPGLHEELDINNSVGCKNNISRGPTTVASELNEHVTPGPVSEADSRFHMDSQLGELVRSPRPPDSGPINIDAVSAQRLISILEDDFIELDDLISPLLGID